MNRLGATWVADESYAYNTYAGGHSRSQRRGKVRFPDGKLRVVVLGVADTFFSIPAHGRVNGRYVSGFVSVSTAEEFEFTPIARS